MLKAVLTQAAVKKIKNLHTDLESKYVCRIWMTYLCVCFVMAEDRRWCNHLCLGVQAPDAPCAPNTADWLMQLVRSCGVAWSSVGTVFWMMHHAAFTSGCCIGQVSQMNSFSLNIFYLFYWSKLCRDHRPCITVDGDSLHILSWVNTEQGGSKECLLSAQDTSSCPQSVQSASNKLHK